MAPFREEWPTIAITALAAIGMYLYARWDARTCKEAREKAAAEEWDRREKEAAEERDRREKEAAEERARREKFQKMLFPGHFGRMPRFLPVEVVMALQKEKALARWRRRGRK